MSVYTVHEPPRAAADAAPNPDRFVFVRDGFYFWAFIATWLWMLWHRMWLALLIYVVLSVAVELIAHYAGVGTAGTVVIGLLIALLAGIEAATLRRFTLARRGWRNVGVVVGDDLEDAERRFFDSWARTPSTARVDRPATPSTPPPSPAAPSPHSPDIVGLFPEPGASR
jgi:hypothetical protein